MHVDFGDDFISVFLVLIWVVYLFVCRIHDFEFTPERAIFDLLGIELYHGWIVDPQVWIRKLYAAIPPFFLFPFLLTLFL